jgi:curved DNA-binding protein CbpA
MSFNFNLYEELEITKKATAEEIKKAYRKLAMVILVFV